MLNVTRRNLLYVAPCYATLRVQFIADGVLADLIQNDQCQVILVHLLEPQITPPYECRCFKKKLIWLVCEICGCLFPIRSETQCVKP